MRTGLSVASLKVGHSHLVCLQTHFGLLLGGRKSIEGKPAGEVSSCHHWRMYSQSSAHGSYSPTGHLPFAWKHTIFEGYLPFHDRHTEHIYRIVPKWKSPEHESSAERQVWLFAYSWWWLSVAWIILQQSQVHLQARCAHQHCRPDVRLQAQKGGRAVHLQSRVPNRQFLRVHQWHLGRLSLQVWTCILGQKEEVRQGTEGLGVPAQWGLHWCERFLQFDSLWLHGRLSVELPRWDMPQEISLWWALREFNQLWTARWVQCVWPEFEALYLRSVPVSQVCSGRSDEQVHQLSCPPLPQCHQQLSTWPTNCGLQQIGPQYDGAQLAPVPLHRSQHDALHRLCPYRLRLPLRQPEHQLFRASADRWGASAHPLKQCSTGLLPNWPQQQHTDTCHSALRQSPWLVHSRNTTPPWATTYLRSRLQRPAPVLWSSYKRTFYVNNMIRKRTLTRHIYLLLFIFELALHICWHL